MILVTLGTQDKPFTRLLQAIEKEIINGTIKDEVIVQAGCTNYQSDKMKIFDLVPMNEFNKYIDDCDLLITHGGVGCILESLKKGKKIIAVPRLAKYNEHKNDHQLQCIMSLNNDGYIIGCKDVTELHDALKKVNKFIPKTYTSNTNNIIKLVSEYIDKN